MGCGKRRLGWVRHKPLFIKGILRGTPQWYFLLEWYPQTKQPFEVYSTKVDGKTHLLSNSVFAGHLWQYDICLWPYTHLRKEHKAWGFGVCLFSNLLGQTEQTERSSCMLVMTGIMRIGQNDFVPHGIWLEEVAVVQGVGKFKLLTTDRFRPTLQLKLQQGESKASSGRSSGYHQSHWEKWGQFASSPKRSSAVKVTSFLHLHHWTTGRDWWQDWGGTKFVALSESPGPGLSLSDDNIEVAEEFCQAGGTVFHIKKPSLRGHRTKRVISFVWDVHPFKYEGWTPN